MIPLYLIGGGWNEETFSNTYGRFMSSATRKDGRKIAIIVAEEEGDSYGQFLRFYRVFESIGLDETEAASLIVSKENPLAKEKLDKIKPTGVFVCGGLTPAYYEALCVDRSWLEYLFENEIPYCGFSAGSSITSAMAIIGGWRRRINNRIVEIADENASEDLDLLDVRNGLGLVNFAVDVHASQWGTFSRLAHVIDAKLAEEGWAIDENTLLEVLDGEVKIFGEGNAYRIKRQKGGIIMKIYQENA